MARPKPVDSLTGLRFFAAAAVVFYHFGAPNIRAMPDFMTNIASGGENGVALFFILSGFVLAYNYADPARNGALDKTKFWLARFARIYPVYLLSLLLTLNLFVDYLHYALRPLSPVGIFKAATSFTVAVTLTQGWFFRQRSLWNYPAWTLSVEMLFYLTFPWVCAAVCRWKPAKLFPTACWLVVFRIGISVIALQLNHSQSGDYVLWAISASPPFRLPEFITGVVLGRMFLVQPGTRIKHRDAVFMLTVIGTMAVVAFGPLPGAFTTALLDPLFALMIFTLASGPGTFAGVLSLPLMVLLGDASYAIYILQVPIMTSADKLSGSHWLTFIAGIFALTGISTVSFLYFETPARKWNQTAMGGSY